MNSLRFVALVLLAQSVSISAQLNKSTDSRACVPSRLIGAIGASNGGRKIGIVIDESSSMESTDPNNIRIVAARTLNEGLISSSKATGGKNPDLVTIVGFNTSPDLYYPLADPTGAVPSINAISSSKGGTFIGGGISTAITELSKTGTGSTANRTGIVSAFSFTKPPNLLTNTSRLYLPTGKTVLRAYRGYKEQSMLSIKQAVLGYEFRLAFSP